ncbi:prolyl 4-hydroxylase subunit alpha-2-like [Haemaphysalis longicornis]
MATKLAYAAAVVAFWIALFLLGVKPCGAYIPPNYVSSRRDDPFFTRSYREVSRWFWRYIEAERKRLDSIRRKLDTLEVAQRSYDGVDPEEYLGLPMNAFLLIKRLAKDYIEVLEEAKDDTNSKLLLAMKPGGKRARRYRLPTRKDIMRTARAVLEFQKNEGYTAKQIAEGRAVDPDSSLYSFKMTARDCFHLGEAASELEDGETAKEWMLEALERVEDGTVDDAVVIREHLAYAYFLEGDYERAAEANKEVLQEEPGNMRAFLNMEFYQEGGPGHCYSKPATLLEATLFKKLTHTEKSQRTCMQLDALPPMNYEGKVYKEKVIREPTTIVFGNVLATKELSVLRNSRDSDGPVGSTAALSILYELSRRIEGLTDLQSLDSAIPWKRFTSDCDEKVWLSPGNNLRSKPFATWWLFTRPAVVGGLDKSLLPEVHLEAGASLLRFHVMSDGNRDREPLPFECDASEQAIFYKRIMLEDQRLGCRGRAAMGNFSAETCYKPLTLDSLPPQPAYSYVTL